jgi:hypothetical protein
VPQFDVTRRADGACLIVMTERYRTVAVAHCPPGCHPTEEQVHECVRAMMGEPVHVDQTC